MQLTLAQSQNINNNFSSRQSSIRNSRPHINQKSNFRSCGCSTTSSFYRYTFVSISYHDSVLKQKTRVQGLTDFYSWNPTRLKQEMFPAPTLRTIRSKAEDETLDPAITKPETLPSTEKRLFLAVQTMPKIESGRNKKAIFLLHVPVKNSTKSSSTAFRAKLTYKLHTTYEILVSTVHTARCLIDIGAGNSLRRSCKLPPSCTNRFKRKNVLKLQTATKLPLAVNRLILPRLSLDELRTSIWLKIASHFGVKFLLGISFVHRFLRKIIPPERKVVCCHSQQIAVLAHNQTPQDGRIPGTVSHHPVQAVDQNEYHDAPYNVVRVTYKSCCIHTQSPTSLSQQSHTVFLLLNQEQC